MNIKDVYNYFVESVQTFGSGPIESIISRLKENYDQSHPNFKVLCLALLLYLSNILKFDRGFDIILVKVNDDQKLTESVCSWLTDNTSYDKLKLLLSKACTMPLLNIFKQILQTCPHTELDLQRLSDEVCAAENIDIMKILVTNSEPISLNLDAIVSASVKGSWQEKQSEFLTWILQNISHDSINWDAVLHAAVDSPQSVLILRNKVDKKRFTFINNVESLVELNHERQLFTLLTYFNPEEVLECKKLTDLLLTNGYSDEFAMIINWLQNMFAVEYIEKCIVSPFSQVFSKACQA